MYKYKLRTFWRFACVICILLVGLSFTGCHKSKTAKIDSLEWRAIADIQEWKSCDEIGWEVPEGAIVYKEQEEIKSYKTIGYETNYRIEEYQELVGYIPGIWRPRYETRSRKVPYQVEIREPVYATRYYYTIDRWVHSKNVLLACGYDQDYNYPDYICAENERVHKVEYTYFVKFEFDGLSIIRTAEKYKWESLQVGQEIPVEKSHGVIYVDWYNINNTN